MNDRMSEIKKRNYFNKNAIALHSCNYLGILTWHGGGWQSEHERGARRAFEYGALQCNGVSGRGECG